MTNTTDIAQTHIRILIPEKYHQEPIISRLISEYHLTVTIKSAFLGANGTGGGWFDLTLAGSQTEINQALQYFQDLKLDTWSAEERKDAW